MSWREINKSPFSICTNEHKKHSGPPPRPFIKGYRSCVLCCMSHSDVFLETIPKPPPWPQKHTNIKIDNDIKELCNNKPNVAWSVCSFVTILPFIFMSHSDTVIQWLFQKLMLLDGSKVNSLKAFQPIFVTIHMSHEVLHLYRHSYSCHTVTQSHSDFSKR